MINIPRACHIKIIRRSDGKVVVNSFASDFYISDMKIEVFLFDNSYESYSLDYYVPLFLGFRKAFDLFSD